MDGGKCQFCTEHKEGDKVYMDLRIERDGISGQISYTGQMYYIRFCPMCGTKLKTFRGDV